MKTIGKKISRRNALKIADGILTKAEDNREKYYEQEALRTYKKDKEEIYIVSISDYESYDPIYVFGPEIKNWEEYCKKLINSAAKNALVSCKNDIYLGKGKGKTSQNVRVDNIRKELLKLLKEKGFSEMEFQKFRMFDDPLDGDSREFPNGISLVTRKEIIKYNKEVNYKFDKIMYEKHLKEKYKRN